MKRHGGLVALAAVSMLVGTLASMADAGGRQSPSLRFFTGGAHAHADWLATDDQPTGDTDPQAIRIVTTTDPNGYAGILVQHVDGQPTATFPDSSFDVKVVQPPVGPSGVNSLGSPRLEVLFSDGGDAALRPVTLTEQWQNVSGSNWDNNSGGCGYRYETTWSNIQACHPGTTITEVYMTTDPYGYEYRIDNLTVDGVKFTQAADNGVGPQ